MNDTLKNNNHTSPTARMKSAVVSLLGGLTALNVVSTHASDAPPPSRVDALLNFEFSDKYLTPRGMIVHEKGLTFQQLALGFFNVYKGDSFINDFTLVGGVWNDFSSSGVSVHAPF